MIEEEYVSFETAKLAKEKGFDIPTRYGFSERRSLVRVDTSDNWNQDKELYSRPTQSLLARWLREKYEIHVEVVFWYYKDSHYCEYTYNITKPLENLTNNVLWFDNYEEAMEEGLKEALKKL